MYRVLQNTRFNLKKLKFLYKAQIRYVCIILFEVVAFTNSRATRMLLYIHETFPTNTLPNGISYEETFHTLFISSRRISIRVPNLYNTVYTLSTDSWETTTATVYLGHPSLTTCTESLWEIRLFP